jgi:hypothetical protein
MTPLFREVFGGIIPVNSVIGIGRSVPGNLPADARVVTSEFTAYFP